MDTFHLEKLADSDKVLILETPFINVKQTALIKPVTYSHHRK